MRANIAAGKLRPSVSAEIEVALALREDAVLIAEQGDVDPCAAFELERCLPMCVRPGPALTSEETATSGSERREAIGPGPSAQPRSWKASAETG